MDNMKCPGVRADALHHDPQSPRRPNISKTGDPFSLMMDRIGKYFHATILKQ